MSDLDGLAARRVALVTGAGAGIGLAIASRLAGDGALVLVNDLDPERAAAAAAELEGDCSAGDVADAAYAGDLVDEVLRRHGRLDVLVNNAAVVLPAAARDLPLGDWRRTLDVNLTAPFVLAVAAAEAMRARRAPGTIVNVASIAGKRISVHGGAAYTASKAGLLGLTRHLAYEYAPYGITINAVCPGGVASPGLRRLLGARGADKRLAQIPAGRFLEPEEVAEAVAFLASERAAGITGVALDVDGGSSLGWEPVAEYEAWMGSARAAPEALEQGR